MKVSKDAIYATCVLLGATLAAFITVKVSSSLAPPTLISKEHLPPHIEVEHVFRAKAWRTEKTDMPETYRFNFSDGTHRNVSKRTYDLYPVGQDKRTIPE